jgi:hypothetical protein
MTDLDHFREAERFAASAEEWMDADYGWKATMSTGERIARRSTDLQAAQVHATLAQTTAAREYMTALNALMAKLEPAPEGTVPA